MTTNNHMDIENVLRCEGLKGSSGRYHTSHMCHPTPATAPEPPVYGGKGKEGEGVSEQEGYRFAATP
jgi:hypothetical protein